nr:MAG TPA: hypothetical protein [Caudoviricetes sp.]
MPLYHHTPPLCGGVPPLWGHIIYNNPHKYTVLARIALV